MSGNTVRDAELEKAVAEFTGAFEVVFHEDWSYVRDDLIHYMDQIIPVDGTFLHPTRDPERVNWGSRAALLRAYERLLIAMREREIEPHRPVRDSSYVYSWKRK
jgi:hypothetical protein